MPAGSGEITFTYNTPNLALGIKISVTALVILAVYLAVFIYKGHKKIETSEYPEGEELLKKWQQEIVLEIAEENKTELSEKEEVLESDEKELTDEELYGKSADFNRGFWVITDTDDNDDNKKKD